MYHNKSVLLEVAQNFTGTYVDHRSNFQIGVARSLQVLQVIAIGHLQLFLQHHLGFCSSEQKVLAVLSDQLGIVHVCKEKHTLHGFI